MPNCWERAHRKTTRRKRGKFRRYLEVITTESHRLSRLISNVLNFARSKKDRMVLRRETGEVDTIIKAALNMFTPSLKAKGVRIHFRKVQATEWKSTRTRWSRFSTICSATRKNTGLPAAVWISKAAAKATALSFLCGITVPEFPGRTPTAFPTVLQNPLRYRRRGDRHRIGLSIARDLARLHGGDLTLVPTDQGACFKIELHTPVRPA